MAQSRLATRCILLLLLLAAGLGIRLGASWWWQQRLGDPTEFAFPDSRSYWVLAQQVAQSKPYQYGGKDVRVFRTPGLPVLLAGWFRLVGDDPPVFTGRILMSICGTLSVLAIMLVAWQLFDERTAWIAGVLATIYPGGIAMSVFVLTEAPFGLLMLLQLSLSIAAWRCQNRGRAALGYFGVGLVAALATLVRPSWLLFLPFVWLFAIALSPRRKRHAWLGLVSMLGLALAMSPWWYRNHQVMGRFIPTTLQVGASLYDGLNARADGSSNMDFVDEFRRQERMFEQGTALTERTFEMRLDNRMRNAAIRWAQDHPTQVLALAGRKFIRMWNVWPNAGDLRSVWMRLIIAAGFIPLIVWGVWGLLMNLPRGWPLILCVLPAVYFSLLHMIFVSSIRYRQPPMLLIVVIAAATLSGYARRRAAIESTNANGRTAGAQDEPQLTDS